MNLLFIRSTTGFSGAERYHEYLFAGLKKRKDISITVFTNFRKFHDRMVELGISSKLLYIPIHEVGTKKTLFTACLWFPYMVINYVWNIKVMEKKKKFDCIILESTTEKILLSPILKLFGYKVFWLEHAPMFNTNRAKIVKSLYAYAVRFADHIIAVSRDTKHDLETHRVPKEKITVWYIGMEKSTGKKNHGKNLSIGYIGGLNEEKGIREFLSAYSILSKENPDLEAYIMGDGPLRRWLEWEILEKGLSRVHVLGFIDNLRRYLARVRIVFFPTKHKEGLSLAILESLSMGKLVVARDIGGNREIVIDSKTGFLFKTDDESIKILKDILAGKKNIKNVQSNISRLLETQFSVEKQTQKFIQFFSSV